MAGGSFGFAATIPFIGGVTKPKAISLAEEELSRLWGVKDHLQNLAHKLGLIDALLNDAEEKQITDPDVRHWLGKLQTVARDADILLDEYGYQVQRQKIETRMGDESKQSVIPTTIANQIKEIKLSLDDVFMQASEIGLEAVEIRSSSNADDTSKVQIPIDPFVGDFEILGRSGFVREVVNHLTASVDEEDLSVVGIVGVAGQGKTTVAQLIYKDEMVVRHFDTRMWLCVSDDFSIERILNEMLQSLTLSVSKITMRDVLVTELSERLNGQRFLLLLDDVWNEKKDTWDSMKKCLQEIGGLIGSKVLVTTRSETVISTMQAFHFPLGVLSPNDGWTLFENVAFVQSGALKINELVNIGKRIVERCRGLPLAIKAIGGVLHSKKNESDWLGIEESNIWDSTDVLSVIELSYDHLPSSLLKQCVAACSIFPKDFVMERKQLVQLWMAQGLLHPSREIQLEMEDLGDNLINILLQRSLLEAAKFDKYGQIESLKMHDVVHDFAVKASKGRCVILEEGNLDQSIECTHLSIYIDWGKDVMPNILWKNFRKLRYLCLSRGEMLPDVLRNCVQLKVLTVIDYSVKELPSSIAELKHLRYLDISCTRIKTLPDEITRLYNLQTLRMNKFRGFPKDFRNLINLRHLHTRNFYEGHAMSYFYLQGLAQLTALCTFPFFSLNPEEGTQIQELGHLPNLQGMVCLYNLDTVRNCDEAAKAKLSSKKNIQVLELNWRRRRPVQDGNPSDEDVVDGLEPHSNIKKLVVQDYRGKKFPSWMLSKSRPFPLQNLVELKLSFLNWCEQLPPLGHLPNLKILCIFDMRNVDHIGNEFYGLMNLDRGQGGGSASIVAFPSLKELFLFGMNGLKEWSDPRVLEASSAVVQVFPQLERLEIHWCLELTSLPSSLGCLMSLESFTITNCIKLQRIPPYIQGKRGGPPSLSLKQLKLNCGPRDFPTDWIEASSTSLKTLEITLNSVVEMDNLTLATLTKLKHLKLHLLMGFKPEDGEQYDPLMISLDSLELVGNSKLMSLPPQVQQFGSLRRLVIEGFGKLEALPEWLANIQGLEILRIEDCWDLAYLPSAEAMQRLVNLRKLNIHDCPVLAERCEEGSGPEWHKVAHIPHLRITETEGI